MWKTPYLGRETSSREAVRDKRAMTLSHLHLLHHHHHHQHGLPLLFLLELVFIWPCIAGSVQPIGYYCSEDIRASYNKSIANANHLLVELVSKAPRNGFVATSYGRDEYIVYGLAQCRGDLVGKKECSSCIQDAAKLLRNIICPRENDARIWFDFCFLRYSYNYNFVGKVDTDARMWQSDDANVTDTKRFNKQLAKLMEKIKRQALEPQNAGLGKGQKKLTPFTTLYALVQCTRDISPFSCTQCLAVAESNFPTYCDGKKGCRILFSNCFVRYELYPFFYPLPSSPQVSSNAMQVQS